jgi:hypothetical protein
MAGGRDARQEACPSCDVQISDADRCPDPWSTWRVVPPTGPPPLTDAILTSPARTPEAIRAKAAALAWELDGEPAEGFHIDADMAAAIRGLLADLAGPSMAI